MDYQLYSTYLPFFSVPEHKTTYRIKGVPCSKLQNCSRESRHTVVYSPTESFSSRKITVSSSVIGDSTSISVATQFQQLKIESPSSDTSSFLVNTRKNDKESGPSLVENENRMKFRGNIQPDPSVPARIKWRVYGPDIDNDTFTTPDGESRKLNLTGPRREDGSPARKVNIEARAAVDGETLTATHTVQQGQGDTYDYSVIRQEYEDVGYTELPANEVPYSGPDGEPRETDFMPSSSDFYKDPVAIPHSADFPAQRFNGESSFSSKDYDYHIHQKNVLNGLKNAINNMTDAERQAVLQANEYFYLYSNYRTPETNKNDSGVADSTHMEGRALDIDTLDHTNHENRWDVLFEFQITNCEALGRFLRQEAGATATHEDGDYETYCPDGEDDSTADESKVHAAWP